MLQLSHLILHLILFFKKILFSFMISLYLKKKKKIKYRSWANMLMHSIKMTIHLLLKKRKRKKTIHPLLIYYIYYIISIVIHTTWIIIFNYDYSHPSIQNWNWEAKRFFCNINAELESSIQITTPLSITNPNLIYSICKLSLSPL